MGLDPVTIGLTALMATGGFMEAREANRARRRQNESVRQAAAAEQANAKIAASERREQAAVEQARFLGTLRASSAARSASSTALATAGIAQSQESVSDINTQLMMDMLGIGSRAEAQMDRRRTSPLFAGIQTGIGGFTTGLSIASSFPGSNEPSSGTTYTTSGTDDFMGPRDLR